MKSLTSRAWFLPLAVALLTLLPLAWCHASFRQLFFFGDELDLLDLRTKLGFGPWVTEMFAENFVPLFKLLWGGGVTVFNGNYFALVVLLWLNHALNAGLLMHLLRRVGLADPAAFFGAMVFSFATINIETLGWVVQWSSVQSLTFFLLGLLIVTSEKPIDSASSRWWLVVFSLASPLCFSRGVLTGPVLACAALFYGGAFNFKPARLLTAALPFATAVAVAVFVALHAQGNHRHLAGHGGEIAAFSFHYFAACPLYPLLKPLHLGLGTGIFWAAIKLLINGAAIVRTEGRTRQLLLALLAFELGNSLILGVGRYHTGIGAALSSRYQYVALFCLLPACAVLFSQLLAACSAKRPQLARLVAWGVAILATYGVGSNWPRQARNWSSWRGADVRVILTQPPEKQPANFSRVSWISNERVGELVEEYNLH